MKLGSDCRSACSSLTTTSRRVWRSIAFQTSPMLPCPSCFCNSYRLIRFGFFGLWKLVLIVLTHTAFFANGGTLSGGAEGAGRRPASLPGLQGVPENLLLLCTKKVKLTEITDIQRAFYLTCTIPDFRQTFKSLGYLSYGKSVPN